LFSKSCSSHGVCLYVRRESAGKSGYKDGLMI
jgi:hypothetical protein